MIKNKLLILGISSFAGASFANYLLNNSKYKIYGTYNSRKKLPFKLYLKKNYNFKKLNLYKLNLNKENNNLIKLIDRIKPNYIIDYASVCMINESWKDPKYYYQVNFFSKINFMNKINQITSLRKYIYISTPEIFGSSNKIIKENSIHYNPSTPYASSKLASEIFLNNLMSIKNNKIIIARFSNFFGPGQPAHRLLPKLIYCINTKKKFHLHGDGSSKRNFIYESDFNEGILKILQRGKTGSKYHFSGNKFHSIKNFIKTVLAIKKYSWSKLIVLTPDRKGKDKQYILCCKKTMKELKWKCNTSLIHGLKHSISFYEKIKNKIYLKDTIYKA